MCGVLKIITVNNSHCFVGNTIWTDYDVMDMWGDAIFGNDGCVYDPRSDQTSHVGGGVEMWTSENGRAVL